MKEFRENKDMYSVPRISAWTASIISNRIEELYEQEVLVEVLLDNVMKAIWDTSEDGGTSCAVDFKGDIDDSIKMEVINRIEDLGYTVKMGVDTEEEEEMFKEYESMAKEDESVANMLDEAYFSSNCYVIFWDADSLEERLNR